MSESVFARLVRLIERQHRDAGSINFYDAREILAEIRELDAVMRKAGAEEPITHSWGEGGEFITEDSAAAVWRAILDRYLST